MLYLRCTFATPVHLYDKDDKGKTRHKKTISSETRAPQVLDACNRFGGRHRVKGMPPGIFAEGDKGSFYGFGKAHAAVVLAMISLVTFAGVKVVKKRRRRRNAGRGSDGEWLAESDRNGLAAQVRV